MVSAVLFVEGRLRKALNIRKPFKLEGHVLYARFFDMKMEKKITVPTIMLLFVLTVAMATNVVSAATLVSTSYTPYRTFSGVIEDDRYDFMMADGNPLCEDIANAVFQGPGVFRWLKTPVVRGGISIYDDSVGFMKDVYLSITGYGTLNKMNYTGEEKGPYHWLPVIEQDAVGTPYGVRAPVEGWLIAYNLTVYPTTFPADEGYLAVTFSGFSGSTITPNVIGRDANDNWALSVSNAEVWVDNPRLLAIYYEIIAANMGSPYTPTFMLQIVVVFNKATKFVEIFQNLELISINIFGCQTVSFNMALGRMAIFDANPYCDRAFYGWKNVTIGDPDIFLVLSWTNSTLEKWVRADLEYDYYGAYMASYPIPDSWAIASTWYDSNDTDTLPEAANVWNAAQLRYTPVTLTVGAARPVAGYLDRYVFLHMGDIDGDGKGDGDQALTRVEWYSDLRQALPEDLVGLETGWKMVMYGVYDVAEVYDGGEGGWFEYGYLCLSNGTAYEDDIITSPDRKIVPVGISYPNPVGAPPYPWIHTGTLGWLNGYVECDDLTSREGMLTKLVAYLDIDQDGNKGATEDNDGDGVTARDEVAIPYEWWPTEELYWQLTYKFAPPVFKKLPPTTCCMFSEDECGDDYPIPIIDGQVADGGSPPEWCPSLKQNDFMVLPAPGATPDAAGAAWLNARFTSMLVTFDVEAYNMVATVGYVNPGSKMLPYLMLRLEPIPADVEEYGARRVHYLTCDGRALPQMEWQYRMNHCVTPWRDKHYMVITVAGIAPNLATYYFNDFTPITWAVGGDYQGDVVVLPYTGVVDTSPYIGTDQGLGVIALAKDHFNNVALLVYGSDAQDTYWTAFIATHDWPYISSSLGDCQALLLEINYSMGPMWGDGDGIPSAHPTYTEIFIDAILLAQATEYESEWIDEYWWD
ncbi:MAG: hypothetical protein QXW94_05610 [Desulfurococcaceae archaeon]